MEANSEMGRPDPKITKRAAQPYHATFDRSSPRLRRRASSIGSIFGRIYCSSVRSVGAVCRTKLSAR